MCEVLRRGVREERLTRQGEVTKDDLDHPGCDRIDRRPHVAVLTQTERAIDSDPAATRIFDPVRARGPRVIE